MKIKILKMLIENRAKPDEKILHLKRVSPVSEINTLELDWMIVGRLNKINVLIIKTPNAIFFIYFPTFNGII